MLELAPDGSETTTSSPVLMIRNNVVVMPPVQEMRPTFRERIIRDLLRTRVMISE
jgi:hypothetical protein